MSQPQLTIDSFLSRSTRRQVQSLVDENLNHFVMATSDSVLRGLLRDALFPGRRLRPLTFMLLLEKNTVSNDLIAGELATVIELCHRGSIILDDLIDEDVIRRGHQTFHQQHGNKATNLLIPLLLGESILRLHKVDKSHKLDLAAEFGHAIRRMSTGELADVGYVSPRGSYVELYESVVLQKTSALFRFVFIAAARLQRFDSDSVTRYATLGNEIGKTYQMYNDVYDESGESSVRRKAPSSYVVNLSLPIAVALDSASTSERSLVLGAIGKTCDSKTGGQIAQLLRELKVQVTALQRAEKQFELTLRLLAEFSPGSTREQLRAFCEWIRQRACWDQNEFIAAGYQ
ncbi:MAG: polyprenyl synthetase family protein [Patescibacteria group bacterium]|jgi:geranylgeranyl pyrophosphate synthase